MKFKLFLLFIFVCSVAFAQQKKQHPYHLNWGNTQTISIANHPQKRLYFENASYDEATKYIPIFRTNILINSTSLSAKAIIKNDIYKPIESAQLDGVEGLEQVGTTIKPNVTVGEYRKEHYALVDLIPLRKNNTTGQYEQLVSFEIAITEQASIAVLNAGSSRSDRANTSVLASGNWYKIAVTQNGIYKITPDFLNSLGISASGIDPRNIRIYGKGGGMLPELNSVFRYDDLPENAIYVDGESDGNFGASDYVLFYGEGPDKWKYDNGTQRYVYQKNIYSDTTYYFITTDLGPGKRITTQPSSSSTPDFNITTSDEYQYHGKHLKNLIKSGRDWFGEVFDIADNYSISFNIPHIDPTVPVTVRTEVAARAEITSTFTLDYNGQTKALQCAAVNLAAYNGTYATKKNELFTFTPTGDNIPIDITYNKPTQSATGWLNYMELNARKALTFSGDQFGFSDKNSVGAGKISEFLMGGAGSAIKIWDVTDPVNVKWQATTLNGSTLSFRVATDTLKNFIAFNGAAFYTPTVIGAVANQNLHGLQNIDLVIIAPEIFTGEANRIANLHQSEGMTVQILTPQQVYNEFSSGSQDICAIREFMRMLYNKAVTPDELPQYLLLFGDGSYDYKNRMPSNTNRVPVYESASSLNFQSSYTADDFYGLLGNSEGAFGPSDKVDIGIGRFPVNTIEEANGVVNKVLGYNKINVASGDWKNIACFIADDEDTNTHMVDADGLAIFADTAYDNFNIDKIYLDAYVQENSASGNTYPTVNDAINRRIEKGTFVMNYTGHGGEVGLAHENIVDIPQINAWENIDRLPLVITATCEFSRFEDPQRTSAGEYVFLNPNGGAIAMFTTTRVTNTVDNKEINRKMFEYLETPVNGEMPTLGDIFRLTKFNSDTKPNNNCIVLFGDPAQKLAYPKHNVITTSINGNNINSVPDTLKALGYYTIAGEVRDKNGIKLTGFNGIVYPTIYDKPSSITTLRNDGFSAFNFSLQKNILFKGKAQVVNGNFSFSFIVPKDINFKTGLGRISYYAASGETDAAGYFENVIIGGLADSIAADNTGPKIDLYMNDTKFVSGGITDENPNLLAFLEDENGINTVGNGIGHDLVATLDGNVEQSFILNDYYESELDNFRKGSLKYPLKNLEEGKHTITLKVWDVYNNSSEASIEFVVSKSSVIALSHVLNYPNPFTTNTNFFFEHNQSNTELDVEISIFTVSGKLVKVINQNVNTEGYRVDSINWDGKDQFGDNIGKGVYVYRLKVKTPMGFFAEKFEKLVILN